MKNFNRRANKPNRVARNANKLNTRVLRGTGRLLLQTTNTDGQGGVDQTFCYANPLSDYTGSQFVENNYEQYKVHEVKVLMKPSPGFLTNPTDVSEAITYQNSVYSVMNNMEVQSFIDYDTAVAPSSYAEILGRPNLKLRALEPNNWTMIARYKPRTLSNPSASSSAPAINFTTNVWMSTEQMNATLYGLRGRVSNRAPVFDTQDNVAAVDLMFVAKVEMRGPKFIPSTAIAQPMPVHTNGPLAPKAPDDHAPVVRDPGESSPSRFEPEASSSV